MRLAWRSASGTAARDEPIPRRRRDNDGAQPFLSAICPGVDSLPAPAASSLTSHAPDLGYDHGHQHKHHDSRAIGRLVLLDPRVSDLLWPALRRHALSSFQRLPFESLAFVGTQHQDAREFGFRLRTQHHAPGHHVMESLFPLREGDHEVADAEDDARQQARKKSVQMHDRS